MQKPLTYDGQGLLDRNSITTEILSQASTKNQVVCELLNYISYLPIFVLASLQRLEVAA